MGRFRKDYSLLRRRRKDGVNIWYYRTYDQYGERTVARSTGETNKTLATRYCNQLMRTGGLVPIKETIFEVYARDWWIWGKCPYCRARLARSAADHPTISERHAVDMRAALERHVLPAFRTRHLSTIRPAMIETWMLDLLDKGLSHKRINNIAGCLRVMLSEAKRLGLLQVNPFDGVRPFAGQGRDRGTFNLEEIRALFGPEALEKAWAGNQLHRTVNMLAACSGMRQGEILALCAEDIYADHIHVVHSWHWRYGLLPTKTRQERDVPVPLRVLEHMAALPSSGGYVFSFDRGETPAAGGRVTKALYEALERIGINAEERKRRNLTFHSWRHTFNSLARARGVSMAILQSVTGHTTAAMTDHYTHFQLEDYRPVAILQAEIFEETETE